VRELLAGEHAEHVGLVLGPGGGAVQLTVAVGIHRDRRVVAGGDRVEAERDRLFEQGGELDVLVAAHARVGGAARGVLGDEVVDDVRPESLGEVPHVVRDAEAARDALGVHRVLDRATAAAAGAQGAGLAAEGEVHAHDLVARVDRARSSDRGVDSPAHRRQDTHGFNARRDGSVYLI
jgi:hypothetical protein